MRGRLPRARKSHIGVMLAGLAAGSAATVTALDSWDKILVEFGFKKSESAVLAEQGAQGDLLRQMTRVLSRRIFWTIRYSGDVTDKFPQADQDEAWKRYNESVIEYNDNYITNMILAQKYFNKTTTAQLQDLHWLLRAINTCLNKIHYRTLYQDKDPACHFDKADGGSEPDNLRVLNGALNQVNAKFGGLMTLLSK